MAWQSSNWLSSSRHDSFRYVEVDKNTMRDLGEIDTIEETGGSIKYQGLTSLKVSAQLPYVGDFNIDNNYIRVYSISTLGEETITVLHGTFMPSRPSTDYSSSVAKGTLECYSLLQLLQEIRPEEPLTIEAGADPIGKATLLIAEAGLSFIADDSSMLLSTSRSYDVEESYLDICNDLMSVAGFSSLAIDSSGSVRLERYIEPENLEPVQILRDDTPQVVLGSNVKYEFDIFEVPNKVIAVKSNTEDEEPLAAVAINDDPTSIYSSVSRGTKEKPRYITHTETVSDVESQEALQAVAERVLTNKSSAVESVEIEHPFLPYITGNALQLVYTKHGLNFTGVAVSKELALDRGMICKVRARRFVRR